MSESSYTNLLKWLSVLLIIVLFKVVLFWVYVSGLAYLILLEMNFGDTHRSTMAVTEFQRCPGNNAVSYFS